MNAPAIEARMFVVGGVVQGVGFRPFVWRLADRFGLTGWVRNRGGLVEIHAEGSPAALDEFKRALAAEAPPLARVSEVAWSGIDVEGHAAFAVDASLEAAVQTGDRELAVNRLVSPDAATCEACLTELLDPSDRRFRYPFVNCTDCGPRFTIIESLPYDRERTSMRAFPMCSECRREYEDPADRRFHAEPVACPACGPRLTLLDADGSPVRRGPDPIDPVASMLEAGAIVAIKGLGGFHLACDATDPAAVRRLRDRKRRPHKPFAVMVRDLDAARSRFRITPPQAGALTSWRAPIVLVADRGLLAPDVAPGYRRHGVMLPSTPVHHLLLRETERPLVMTSGNASDEPICIDNDEAVERLAGVADAFLVHDREIVSRYDDSVVHVPTVIRRARSFAPASIDLPAEVGPILGVGAELNGAFCLAAGRRAFLSQHIGDLDSEESMAAYRAALARYREVLRIEPQAVAHDLHPDFLTTRLAEELGLPRVAVQHHHAHVVATMAEHGLQGEVLGLAFDGLGLGTDGTIWGGELLVCDWAGSERVGRLRRVRQPGGDAATSDPVRMAIAHARDADVLDAAVDILRPAGRETEVVLRQIESGLASPLTSSAGRLFDAVAALTGVCRRATYEGQPAMLLEQAAIGDIRDPAPAAFERLEDGILELDTRPLVAAVVSGIRAGEATGSVAGRFHASFAAAVVSAATAAAKDRRLDRAVLGGGVFHNELLVRAVVSGLTKAGLRVFGPKEVPVGDGGIALGQVLVAHGRLAGRSGTRPRRETT